MKLIQTKLPSNIEQMFEYDPEGTAEDLTRSTMIPITGDLLLINAVEELPLNIREDYKQEAKELMVGKYAMLFGLVLCGKAVYDALKKI